MLTAWRPFTDPDKYFAEIRNLREGLVLRRGEFRAGSTVIQLPRAWMCRFDEDLQNDMEFHQEMAARAGR